MYWYYFRNISWEPLQTGGEGVLLPNGAKNVGKALVMGHYLLRLWVLSMHLEGGPGVGFSILCLRGITYNKICQIFPVGAGSIEAIHPPQDRQRLNPWTRRLLPYKDGARRILGSLPLYS